MSIAEFKKQLAKSAVNRGANWLKADFHVHAPGSSDYEYRGDDAFALLGAAIDQKECRFAIILKHQEFPTHEELTKLQKYCRRTTLIPGAEINVFVDALFKKIGKDYYFHCIVAVDPDGDRNYNYILTRAKETFRYRENESYPAGFTSAIVDIGKFFRERGAIFIPAHLHQGKSADTSRSIDDLYDDEAFLGFINEKAFDALEVRAPSTAAFFDGMTQTKEGLNIPLMVCVQSTDSHHHEHMANRNKVTWIRSEKPTFDELKAALTFRHRVRLSEPTIGHARVVGIHVVGSFIKEVWVPLNEGFNALIGSKGSGKTALVECIRFALNTHIPKERTEQVTRHLNHILGSSGYVECLIASEDGSETLVTRRADAPDRITLTDSNGETRQLSSRDLIPFPISILGWHEIEAVADQADARIALLDQIGDAAHIATLLASIKSKIEQARDQLPLLQRAARRLRNSLRELWDLQRKRSSLQRLQQGEILTLQQRYEWLLSSEQTMLGLADGVRAHSDNIAGHIAATFTATLDVPREDALIDVEAAYTAVSNALAQNALQQTASADALKQSLGSIEAASKAAATSLQVAFARFRDETYLPKVSQLSDEDRNTLTSQIQILEQTKQLPLIKRRCDDLLAEVKASATQMKAVCDSVSEVRKQISDSRHALIQTLNAELTGVRLNLLPFANQSARDSVQRRFGEDAELLFTFMNSFGKSSSYENLSQVFDKLAGLTLDQGEWHVDNTLFDARVADLFEVVDDDDLEIHLEVGSAGYVPIQNLSAGQRCVAVFPLLLRNAKGPLIIDQPEDNLDNRYIANIIGPDLLEKKSQQQFLVTSHNANLVVLTDADLIVHADSDGTSASFPSSGFLSCSKSAIRQSVLEVLDGGDTALAARQKKYGTAAT